MPFRYPHPDLVVVNVRGEREPMCINFKNPARPEVNRYWEGKEPPRYPVPSTIGVTRWGLYHYNTPEVMILHPKMDEEGFCVVICAWQQGKEEKQCYCMLDD